MVVHEETMIQQASTLAHIRSLQAQRYAAMQQADQDAFARPCALVYVHSNCVQDALARYLAGKNGSISFFVFGLVRACRQAGPCFTSS
ncbi:ABC transporter substrate-binding protein, partial [Pseudomonas amygdali]|uniref:ABC transporter substrate-binding protein n=1 Tax=Pseudomonas amygdali TaxID=47877 RepID=UPI000C097ABC